MDSYTTDLPKVGILVPLPGTEYLANQDGERLMRFPAIHSATRGLVYVVAPALNSCEASVLRDCPELEPYQPTLPEDLDWPAQTHQGIRMASDMILMQGQAAELERLNMM